MLRKSTIISLIILTLLATSCSVLPQTITALLEDQGTSTVDTISVSSEVTTTSDAESFDSQLAAAQTLYQNQDQVISLYKSASPSVVNITSVDYVFNRMLGQLSEEGIGSGFVYDTEGHIITNYHVVEGADELIVTLSSDEKYEATVVGVDSVNDLAVLYIDAGSSLPTPLSLANSDDVQVGETVLAIGNPYGLDWTLTTGVVSALGRVIKSTEDGQYIADAIQTDAAINPGNSGGPLINMSGQVIGINSQIISESGSSSGLGFAISANTIIRIVPQIISQGYYLHPWLGLSMIDLTDYSIAILEEAGMDIPVESGVLVVGFENNSPADDAGVQSGDRLVRFGPYVVPIGGDIITAIDGTAIESQQDLMIYLETQTTIGDTVQLSIIRNGSGLTLSVTLTAQPSSN